MQVPAAFLQVLATREIGAELVTCHSSLVTARSGVLHRSRRSEGIRLDRFLLKVRKWMLRQPENPPVVPLVQGGTSFLQVSHSRESGNLVTADLDSRFRGNDIPFGLSAGTRCNYQR
jgi:hypothetical protein